MTAPSSPPCRFCGQEPLSPHLTDCVERVENRRYLVSLTTADRRWRNRKRGCHTYIGTKYQRRCKRPAILWLVGPRGGIIGQWCDRHCVTAYRTLRDHSTATLRNADYEDRGTPEEIAMWGIGRGPEVRPWYGPAART